MAASALVRSADMGITRGAPKPWVLWAIALAGCAAAAVSVELALTSDHVKEPGLQAGLMNWITLPYIISGAIAWYRRPDSRLGPLMIAAGLVAFLSTLSWTNADVPHTLGQTVDLLPAALFLHVFLAYPSGRLEHWLERSLVAAAYFAAIGLELVGMLLGGFGPDNLLEVTKETGAAEVLLRVQLVALSVL